MADTNYWRTDRPIEGLIDEPAFAPGMPVRTFLPDTYEHGYAYPLLVFFHPHGSNEDRVLKLAPRTSTQNFLYMSLRGPEKLARGKFGWAHPNADEMLAEYVRLSVQLARATYHIHSERIYLVGVRDGAAAAYRAGLALGEQIGGVIALNGLMPKREAGQPLANLANARNLPVFLAHGRDNRKATRVDAVRDYKLLYAAGANVRYTSYETNHKLIPAMLKDVNRWVVGNVNAEHDMYVTR